MLHRAMRRFFLPPASLDGESINIDGPEARHLSQVLRLGPGAHVEFFDGSGLVYVAELVTVGKLRVTARVTDCRQSGTPHSVSPLTVAQALLKGKKMDLLVQKATELGVHAFVPVLSRRCENHGHREHQIERWQRIMIEACKQSHRDEPMLLHPATPLADLETSGYAHRLAAWEDEPSQELPGNLAAQPGPICLLLGPEGGLDPSDLDSLRARHFLTVSLGAHILRGETATLAAIAIIQYQTGVLRPGGDGPAPGPPSRSC